MKKAQEAVENITIQLRGEEALRFRAYKEAEFLRLNSEAGGKLVREGLARHEAEKQREKVA